MKLLVSTFLLAGLVAPVCADDAQRSAAAARNPESACIDGLAGKPELAPIAEKVGLAGLRDQPFSMLARADGPTDDDKPILRSWIVAKQECFLQGQAWRRNQALRLHESLAESVYARFLSLTAELHAGRLTYGEYAAARVELAIDAALGAANADVLISLGLAH